MAELSSSEGRVCVVCNAYFPFVAFVVHPDAQEGLEFVDAPVLAAGFSQTGEFTVVCREVLDAVPTEEDLGALSTAEREQIRYWTPRRLGDIIYNWWD